MISGGHSKEEMSNLSVSKEKPKRTSFFIHMERTGTEAVDTGGW